MDGLDFILVYEPFIRSAVVLVTLFLLLCLEMVIRRRKLSVPRTTRWISNLGLTFFNNILVRVMAFTFVSVFPILPVGAAIWAKNNNWGLLNILDLPIWFTIPFTIVFFDLIIWIQHALFHRADPLWRLHRTHHTDLDIDVTSAARFHPLEILISLGIKTGVVIALGPPAAGVVIFEIGLAGMAFFTHADIYIPDPVDRILRKLFVTPDMHRIHHSNIYRESYSNFGTIFSWWDRLFSLYTDEPKNGQLTFKIGLDEYREPRKLHFLNLILQPFNDKSSRSKETNE
ncbi:MAG: sterol desaturase family protein [Candidatus Thermoplasmatota archaeon]|jgi:sterol desaturase/sphingolipid hydroxylase (fatty acid hydroxylase superfamily)|nr:sterol desaturase family protein [Candidatus Thermoplasmatota archaeon]MDP7265894.1 sterol desaturase family protein [Candidatus Thermoplasmatota archaeon]